MHLKPQFFPAYRCICHVESLRALRAETPSGQTNGRFKNIMKNQLYTTSSNKNR